MKVIMLKDVGGIGRKNQIIEVADGFALNSLIPQGKAAQATAAKIAEVEKHNAAEARITNERKAKLAAAILSLQGQRIEIKAKANEHGHLFKGIHKQDVAQELSRLAGVAIDSSTIEGISEVTKEAGAFDISIAGAGTKAHAHLVIIAQ